MKGYKGMKADMTCTGFKFEVGKEYTIDGALTLCANGFHFCKSLSDVFNYYVPEEASRYFAVEAKDEAVEGRDKIAARTIKIVREISPKDVWRTRYGNSYGDGIGYSCGIGGDTHGFGDGAGVSYGDGCGNGWGQGAYYGYSDGCALGYNDSCGFGDGYSYGYGYGNNLSNRRLLTIVLFK